MRFYLKYVLLLLFFTGAGQLQAQEVWSLENCIHYALEHNIEMKDFAFAEQLAIEDQQQARRAMLPGVNASSSAGISFGRSIDPGTNGYIETRFFNNNYNLGSSLTVFDGFRLQNTIKYRKIRTQMAGYQHENAADNLAFEVMTVFFEVIYFEEMGKIASEQVEASKLQLKTIEKKTELGLLAKADLLEMRANLEQEELLRIQIENKYKTYTLRLRQLLNLSGADSLDLDYSGGAVLPDSPIGSDDLYEGYLTWAPYYQIQQLNVMLVQKSLALARSQLYPQIEVNAFYSTRYYDTDLNSKGNTSGFSSQFKNNRGQYVGASLTIPVFSRWSGRSGIKKARIELDRATVELESEKQKLYFEIMQSLTELKAAQKEYQQYLQRAEVDQLAFQAAKKMLDQGLININDYYIAKNRLANTQGQIIRSRTQLDIQMKTLEFYKGIRFWE